MFNEWFFLVMLFLIALLVASIVVVFVFFPMRYKTDSFFHNTVNRLLVFFAVTVVIGTGIAPTGLISWGEVKAGSVHSGNLNRHVLTSRIGVEEYAEAMSTVWLSEVIPQDKDRNVKQHVTLSVSNNGQTRLTVSGKYPYIVPHSEIDEHCVVYMAQVDRVDLYVEGVDVVLKNTYESVDSFGLSSCVGNWVKHVMYDAADYWFVMGEKDLLLIPTKDSWNIDKVTYAMSSENDYVSVGSPRLGYVSPISSKQAIAPTQVDLTNEQVNYINRLYSPRMFFSNNENDVFSAPYQGIQK